MKYFNHPVILSTSLLFTSYLVSAEAQDTAKSADLALTIPSIDQVNVEQCQTLSWPSSDRLPSLEFTDDNELPVQVETDSVQYDTESDTALFVGNVQFSRGQQQVSAENINYNKINNTLKAKDNVNFYQPDLHLRAQTADIQLNTHQAILKQTEYYFPTAHIRGNAKKIVVHNENSSDYSHLTFTTCPTGNNDWHIDAEQLQIDRVAAIGTVHDATLTFKDVPILYLPYATFPLDDRRKSGFLLPRVGYSSRNGFQYAQPYYFNLAPNYDLTVTPKLLSRRGLIIGGDFRYLLKDSVGSLRGEYLPSDRLYTGDNRARGAIAFRHKTTFTERLKASVRADWVSDESYLDDVASDLRLSSTRHLQRDAVVDYRGDNWTLLGRAQSYQTIDEAIPVESRPYTRLPQFLYQLDLPEQMLDSEISLRAEYVNFQREGSIDGQRIDVLPSISFPFRQSWGFLTPRLSARYTTYALDGVGANESDSPDRFTGTFSLDSGLFFDRPIDWFGYNSIQTIEPRVFYTYTPYVNQDDIPVFDADNVDFSFLSLFYENRFSGADRVGDANQLTLALTSRTLYQENGVELLRGSIGQVFFFDDREVQLPDVAEQTTSNSAIVGEIAAALSYEWSSRASIQWNPNNDDPIEKSAIKLRYRGKEGNRFTVGYRLTQDTIENIDLSASWFINPQLKAIAKYDYSLLHNDTIELVAGFETGNCCWRWRALVRQYLENTNEDPNLTFMFQLELRGLGKIGNGIDEYLNRSIEGYNR